jgi:hypothetical protein
MVKHVSDNEIYLLIKYIESVLWRVAKRLSYIEEARCLKFNGNSHQCEATIHRFKSLVNDFVYSFGGAAPMLLVEV